MMRSKYSLFIALMWICLSGCSSTPEDIELAAAVDISAEKTTEKIVELDVVSSPKKSSYPHWVFIPPEEEGFCFGVGSDKNLELAKAKAIVSVGQQFNIRVRSILIEKSISNPDGEDESVVTSISEQITDQVVRGAKFYDQYTDDRGINWVLSRAPFSCAVDAVESILISYSLELKQDPQKMKESVNLVERELKEEPLEDNKTKLSENLIMIGDFWIGQFEVSRADWEDVMGSLPDGLESDSSELLPVSNISWFDAIQFCNSASERDGLVPAYAIEDGIVSCFLNASGYRLPTETEWEFAASGGSLARGALYSGYNRPEMAGWSSQNSEGRLHTSGELNPNEVGLYDMSGNLWEWCWDKDDNLTYEGLSARALRGGSWNYPAEDMMINSRGRVLPGDTYAEIGFRVVKSVR